MAFLECDYYFPFLVENVRSECDSAGLVTVDDHSVLVMHAQNNVDAARSPFGPNDTVNARQVVEKLPPVN
jgi:hypothetical protein